MTNFLPCHRNMRPLAAAILAAIPSLASAGSAAPGAVQLETLTVNAEEQSAPALAGGVDLLFNDSLNTNSTVSEALASTPGVIVQDFFGGGAQPRIQIRGSGLQQNPVERGILILQDGLPINRADGSYIVGLANPSLSESFEVYRGYLANRLNATVLGGAVNFISPTGHSAPGGKISLNAGSFAQRGGQASYGWQGESADLLVHANTNRSDGYRDYNASELSSLGANGGVTLSANHRLEAFTRYTELDFEIPGPTNEDGLKDDPQTVYSGPTMTSSGLVNPGPNVQRDKPQRRADQLMAGVRSLHSFGDSSLDLLLGYSQTNDSLRFPVASGQRDTDGGDATAVVRYAYGMNAINNLPLLELTAQFVTGSADRHYYLNEGGTQGEKFGENTLDAQTLSLTSGMNIALNNSLTLAPSVSWSSASRDNDDTYSEATRPTMAYNPANPTVALATGSVTAQDTSYQRDYEGWTPSLSLSWKPADHYQVFTAISRSFEPPTHDDLIATMNGTPNSSPGRPTPGNAALDADAFITPDLKAQYANTFEAGSRGKTANFSWDLVAYYSRVKNEVLSLRNESGTSLGSVNADKTRHLGAELGLKANITDTVSSRIIYNYQDFLFKDDDVRGNNRLAGAPRHMLNVFTDLRATNAWSGTIGMRWMIEKTPVDNMNTLYNDPYAVFDISTRYQATAAISLSAAVTNIFDENYASSTLVVDQVKEGQAVYLPGDGRAYSAGITMSF